MLTMKTLKLETNQQERYMSSSSSKGNQIKWKTKNMWLKADNAGFESLAEIISSDILSSSNISHFVVYSPVLIRETDLENDYRGCMSYDFLEEGEELITLVRLFQSNGLDIYREMEKLDTVSRIQFVSDNVKKFTGLVNFDKWLCKLIEFDAFILNDDRHFHNIAVIKTIDCYKTMAIFDNGGAFLSDRIFYPITKPFDINMRKVKAKPFNTSFSKQVSAAIQISGQQLKLKAIDQSIFDDLSSIYHYSELEMVKRILAHQAEKYKYLVMS